MKFNYEIWCANGPVKRWQKQKWNDLNNVGNKAKGRILKHVSQVKQAHQIFQKQTFLTPWYTNVRMYVRGGGGRNNRSSENLAYFVSLRHPFWDSPFCLITTNKSYSSNILLTRSTRTAVKRPCINIFLNSLRDGEFGRWSHNLWVREERLS